MKTYRVEFTPDARKDMIDYALYIANQEQDNDRSLAWHDGMHEAVMGLETMPNRHGYARENDAFEETVRQVIYKSHRAIYTVHEDISLVAIHRVRHTASDDAGLDDLPGLAATGG
ncbi:type II toxin-antitoxin system RelE/ParE family toxin [bacterium AH-315-J04]|nr:type II toxin-antitoxin system RelE/ParE family toxin [bacterium AH-315-J04]